MRDETFLELVDICYGAAEEAGQWQVLVETLIDLFEADAGDLTFERYALGDAVPLGTSGYDPRFRASYDDRFLGDNPWTKKLKQFPRCRAIGAEFEPEAFERSPYYVEWLRPQGYRHEFGAILDHRADRIINISFSRHQARGAFVSAQTRSLDRILPHIRRAAIISEQLSRSSGSAGQLNALIDGMMRPAFLLDSEGRIAHSNEAAAAFLRHAGNGLSIVNGSPVLRDHAASRQLGAAIARSIQIDLMVAPGEIGDIVMRREQDGRPPVVLQVYPLRSGVLGGGDQAHSLLLINDPAQELPDRVPLLQQVWQLTTAEAALAMALASGETLAAYAERSGVAASTVRWHLKNIQSKTGTRRAEDVVRLVHGTLLRM